MGDGTIVDEQARRRGRRTLTFVAALSVIALAFWAVTCLAVERPFAGDVTLGLLLLLLGIGAERLNIDLYGRGRIIPTASIVVAAALLLGPAGGGLVGGGATLLAAPRTAPWRKRIFNSASTLLVGTLLGVAAAPLLDAAQAGLSAAVAGGGALPLEWRLLSALPVGLVLGGALFVANIGLLTTVMAISEGFDPATVYRERLRWLAPYTLAYGVIGVAMAIAADLLGPLALLVFAIPAVLLRQVSAQLIEATRGRTEALIKTRDELQVAYGQVRDREQVLETLVGELQRANEETIRAFSAMLDARDRETEGHSERVVGYALTIAEALGLDEAAIPHLELGALLHDIGKVGIPDAILLKPGPLDEAEWAVMRQHPVIGTNLVRDIDTLRHAIPVIRHHHERWDGGGYPDRLSGEAIPLAARIFSVADVYDALISDRPYRAGMAIPDALRIIRGGRGSQFDPRVVDAFEELAAAGALPPPCARQHPPLDVEPAAPLMAAVGSALAQITVAALGRHGAGHAAVAHAEPPRRDSES